MNLTVKELREALAQYPDDYKVDIHGGTQIAIARWDESKTIEIGVGITG